MLPIIYLTRTEYFNAAHQLYNKNWTDEKNKAVFGKCANPNFHGHNYSLSVTIKGMPGTETGFIFNAKKLGDIMEKEIVELLDHKNLNLDIPYFKEILPSVENLTVMIWNILYKALQKPLDKQGKLHKILLQETPTIFAEYYGECKNL